MGAGARMRPSQLQSSVPVKCMKVGRNLLWIFFLGILFLGVFLSHTLICPRTGKAFTERSFEFPSLLDNSNETILSYSLLNPSVSAEREKIQYLFQATDSGRKGLNLQFLKPVRTAREEHRSYKARHERSWIAPFISPSFQRLKPQFFELAKTWLGDSGDFNPGVMQEMVETVKGSMDRNVADWSRITGNYSVFPNRGKRYQTCAVVGNSGILLKQDYGEQIDSHDMVMRLNNAGIDQYAKHVGSKTTLSFINSNILKVCATKPGCWCQTYGDEVPLLLYICQANHWVETTWCMTKHISPLLVTHSHLDALCAAIVKWYSVTNFRNKTGLPVSKWFLTHSPKFFHYSSGMEAVVVALGICDSVDLFGFGKSPDAKHHYHTEQKTEQSLHDYAAEYLFYDDLVHNRTVPFLRDAGIPIPPVRIYY